MILGFIMLAVAGVFYLFTKAIDAYEEAKIDKEAWRSAQISYCAECNRKRYNNYIYTCPVCGASKVIRISDASRTISVAVNGLASNKIGKQYECENCLHMW